MSLLVHELMIGTGSGGTAGPSGLHASSSSKSGSISSVNQTSASFASISQSTGPLSVVTHNVKPLQFSPIQQSRVVTIASNHSKLSTNENGSKLAEALAGTSSYAYSSAALHIQTPQTPTKSSSTNVSHSQWHHYAKTTSRQSYNLPFVLQDHNYGAPPPPTPPHSPPHPSPTSPLSIAKIQQACSSLNAGTSQKVNSSSTSNVGPYSKKNTSQHKLTPDQVLSVNPIGPPSPSTLSPVKPNSSSIAPPFLSSMPLHRQQFMPHPRLSGFNSPHVPSNTSTDVHPNNLVGTLSNGIDTDEESRLSDRSSSVGPSGEETETAPEGEGEELIQADDSITRCICDFTHDDGYMIQCDRCLVWQHVDCMEIDRNNIPEEYLCEACSPRHIDKAKARTLQVRRRQEIKTHLSRISSSDSDDNSPPASTAPKRNLNSKPMDRKVLKKKKSKASKDPKSTRKQLQSYKKSPFMSPHSSSSKLNSNEEKEKKSIVKSRRQRQSSATINSDLVEDFSGSVLDYIKSWVEDYEVAVTNHYSPELRAKVHSARLLNGISPEFRDSTQGAMLGLRCKVAPNYNSKAEYFESKVLVATTDLLSGTAIIEFQGKYTLQSQWGSVMIPPGLPYLPFVLQYTMKKEGLGICVDARTYGNDARFARRNKENNAEIRHVVERGSVHLYIVACKDIGEEEEIFLSLDSAISVPPATSKSLTLQKTPTVPPVTSDNAIISVDDDAPQNVEDLHPVRKNGSFQVKKSCRRQQPPPLSPTPSVRPSRRATSTESDDQTSPIINSPLTKQRRSSGCGSKSPMNSPAKSPVKSPLKSFIEESPKDDISPMSSPQYEGSTSGEKEAHKMTREERKIAAYMKAFERMEKASQKRKENARKKTNEKPEDNQKSNDNSNKENCEKPRSQLRRSSEGIGENKRKKRKKSSSSVDTPEKHSGNSFIDATDDNNGSSSEGERCKNLDGGNVLGSSSSYGMTGFRFPKTKKALMNEWLNETVNPVLPSGLPCNSDVTSGVPTCYMRSPSTPVRRASGSSNSGSCNSSCLKTSSLEMAGRSAKKRWLRQAIIDETEPHATNFTFCSSPNSRPDSPNGCIDYITPLKKRRLARESMSSEQSNTPPTTPAYPGIEEDKSSVEFENDHVLEENLEFIESKGDLLDAPKTECIKEEKKEISLEGEDYESKEAVNDISKDQLTVNIFELSKACKKEIKTEFSASETVVKSKPPSEKDEPLKDISGQSHVNEACVKKPSSKNKENISKSCNPNYASNLKKKILKKKLKLDIKKAKNKAAEANIKRGFVEKDHKKKSLLSVKKRQSVKSTAIRQDHKLTSKEKQNLKSSVKTGQGNKKSKNKKETPKRKPSAILEDENKLLPRNNLNINEIMTFSKNIAGPDEESKKIETQQDVVYNPSSLNELCLYNVDTFPKSPPHSPLNFLARGPKTPDGTPPETPVKASEADPIDHVGFSECNSEKVCLQEDLLPPNEESKPLTSSSTTPINAKEKPNEILESSDLEPNFSSTSLESFDSSCFVKDRSKEAKTEQGEAPSRPAPVKRKLSLLEYRKRKSINCEREPKDNSENRTCGNNFSMEISSGVNNPFGDMLSTSLGLDKDDSSSHHSKDSNLTQPDVSSLVVPVTSPSPVELDDLSNSPPSPPSPSIALKTYLESENVLDDKLGKPHSLLKWNEASSLCEKQRENLTARLRREFGLCLHEEALSEDLKKNAIAERRSKDHLNDKNFSSQDPSSLAGAPSLSLKDRPLLAASTVDQSADRPPSTLQMNRLHFASVPKNALRNPLSFSSIEENRHVLPSAVQLPQESKSEPSKGNNAPSISDPNSQTELL